MKKLNQSENGSGEQFTLVARVYDELMDGIAYDVWLRYLKQIWKARKVAPRSILDVACGTGNMSFPLAELGFRVVGVDYSRGMIDVALAKLPRGGNPDNPFETNPAFVCQNASEIDIPESFDCAISLFDSLNYIIEYEALCRCFRSVFKHLKPGGLFVFDLNTEYSLSHGFFDQDNLGTGRYPRYDWVSIWDGINRICTIEMDFEYIGENGVVSFRETHRQRAYSVDELTSGLAEAGFIEIEFFQAYTFKKPNNKTDRYYIVCLKPV